MMSGRPFPAVVAAVLLLVIGISGLSAGVALIAAMGSARDVPPVGVGIGAAIGTYSALTTGAGVGLLLRRHAAWWLAVLTIGAGLLFLVGMVAVVLRTLDPVFAFGIVVWSVTLACLVAIHHRP